MAVAIKERLENGDYGIVKCLYNKQTEGVEDMAKGIESEQVDAETQRHFGNKEMIVLEWGEGIALRWKEIQWILRIPKRHGRLWCGNF